MFSKYADTRDYIVIVCCDVCRKVNNAVPITDNNMAHSAARRSTDRMSYSELQTRLTSRLLREEHKAGWWLCSSLYKACGWDTRYGGDWLSDVSEELELNLRMK